MEDWKLSYNERNLTNYTKFGVKNGSVKPQRLSLHSGGGGLPTTRLGQSFFNRRMHLQSPITSEMERFFRNIDNKMPQAGSHLESDTAQESITSPPLDEQKRIHNVENRRRF